jgi:hypothetical protein
MIRTSISESEGFASLSPQAAVLFAMLIPHFNAHGKMAGGPGAIKDEVVPLIPYFSYENLPQYLQEISDKTNVKWFRSGAKWWLHALNFKAEHQDLRTDRLGPDELPEWLNGERLTSSTDAALEQSGSSPGVVLAREGLKGEERTKVKPPPPTAPARDPSLAEQSFERCFEVEEHKIRQLFPLLDFELVKAKCLAKYRGKPPRADPLVTILKFCEFEEADRKSALRREQSSKGGQYVGQSGRTARERAPGLIEANGPNADFLGDWNDSPAPAASG